MIKRLQVTSEKGGIKKYKVHAASVKGYFTLIARTYSVSTYVFNSSYELATAHVHAARALPATSLCSMPASDRPAGHGLPRCP